MIDNQTGPFKQPAPLLTFQGEAPDCSIEVSVNIAATTQGTPLDHHVSWQQTLPSFYVDSALPGGIEPPSLRLTAECQYQH